MSGQASGRDCPSDEMLAGWIEQRLSERVRQEVERHVAGCAVCADVAAALLPPGEATLARRIATAPTARQAPVVRVSARRESARALRWAVAAALVIATAALAYTAVDAALGRMRTELARRASLALGEPVVIGRLGLGLTPDLRGLVLRVRDVRIGGEDGLSADGLELSLSLAALAARSIDVRHIRLLGPLINVSATPPGGAPLKVGHVGGANAVAAALGIAPVEIVDGTLIAGGAGGTLRIEHLEGTATPDGPRLVLAFAGTSAGGNLHLDGEIPAATTSGQLAVSLGGRALDVAQLPFTRDHLTGHADLTATLSGTTEAPMIQGRAVVHDGRARGWNPLPQALAALGGGAVPADMAGATGPDLAFDELRLVVVHTARGWRIPRLYASAPGFVVDATTIRLHEDQAIDGSGSVRLAAPLAALVIAAEPSLATRREDDGGLTVPITLAGSLAAPRLTPVVTAPPGGNPPADRGEERPSVAP